MFFDPTVSFNSANNEIANNEVGGNEIVKNEVIQLRADNIDAILGE